MDFKSKVKAFAGNVCQHIRNFVSEVDEFIHEEEFTCAGNPFQAAGENVKQLYSGFVHGILPIFVEGCTEEDSSMTPQVEERTRLLPLAQPKALSPPLSAERAAMTPIGPSTPEESSVEKNMHDVKSPVMGTYSPSESSTLSIHEKSELKYDSEGKYVEGEVENAGSTLSGLVEPFDHEDEGSSEDEESSEDKSEDEESAEDESEDDTSSEEESSEDESSDKESSEDEYEDEESSDEESSNEESSKDESSDEEYSEDESEDEESSEDKDLSAGDKSAHFETSDLSHTELYVKDRYCESHDEESSKEEELHDGATNSTSVQPLASDLSNTELCTALHDEYKSEDESSEEEKHNDGATMSTSAQSLESDVSNKESNAVYHGYKLLPEEFVKEAESDASDDLLTQLQYLPSEHVGREDKLQGEESVKEEECSGLLNFSSLTLGQLLELRVFDAEGYAAYEVYKSQGGKSVKDEECNTSEDLSGPTIAESVPFDFLHAKNDTSYDNGNKSKHEVSLEAEECNDEVTHTGSASSKYGNSHSDDPLWFGYDSPTAVSTLDDAKDSIDAVCDESEDISSSQIRNPCTDKLGETDIELNEIFKYLESIDKEDINRFWKYHQTSNSASSEPKHLSPQMNNEVQVSSQSMNSAEEHSHKTEIEDLDVEVEKEKVDSFEDFLVLQELEISEQDSSDADWEII